jgi:hypothetical protein
MKRKRLWSFPGNKKLQSLDECETMQKVTNIYSVSRLTLLVVDERGKGAKLKSGVLPGLQKKGRRTIKNVNTRRIYFFTSHNK